jgi:hypothetical protein
LHLWGRLDLPRDRLERVVYRPHHHPARVGRRLGLGLGLRLPWARGVPPCLHHDHRPYDRHVLAHESHLVRAGLCPLPSLSGL